MSDIPTIRANINTMIDKGATAEQINIILADDGLTYNGFLEKSLKFDKAKGIKTDVGFGRLFAQGLTLGFSDEIEAFARSLSGEDYNSVRDSIRFYTDEYREENPGTAITAEVLGALAPTAAALIAAPFTGGSSVAAAAPGLVRAGARIVGTGAAVGGVAGLGAGEGTPAEQAKSSATGALFGGATAPLAPLAAEAVKGVYRAARPILSRGAQENVVGDILNQSATNPAAARQALRDTPTFVPGSYPTTAQAARDPGLAALQTPVRSTVDDSNRIAQRLSEQNEARQSVLGRISGEGPETIAYAERKRKAITDPMRERAFSGTPVSADVTSEVLESIERMLAAPSGKRATISQALKSAKTQIKKANNVRELYEIRKDLQLARLGKLSGPRSDLRHARSELRSVIDEIDDVIESAAPGYGAYMKTFQKMSRPIDQMTSLQNLRTRSALSGPDVRTGQDVLSQAKFKRELLKFTDEDKLSNSQTRQVSNILKDLNRSVAPVAPGVKVPGSDSVKNLTVANLIGQYSKNPNSFTQAVGEKLSFLYKWPEASVREALVDAMLDPKIAAAFMQKASDTNVARVSAAIKTRLRNTGIAATAGTMSGLLTNQP